MNGKNNENDMGNNDLVDIPYDEIRHTPSDLATLFIIDNKEVWIPKSLIEDISNEDGPGEVTIPEWFCISEGLI